MTINDKISNEKPQNNINRETAKIFILSSDKIDKIWLNYRRRNITFQWKQSNRTSQFVYSTLGKALEKQTKKQTDAWKSLRCFNK